MWTEDEGNLLKLYYLNNIDLLKYTNSYSAAHLPFKLIKRYNYGLLL